MGRAKALWLTNIALLISCSWTFAQNPQLRNRNAKRFPTVVFTSVLWNADPAYYSIAIDSSGAATYESAPESLGKTGVPYTIRFQVSDRTRRIAFNIAQRLNFFAGISDPAAVSPDRSSVRTLTYIDGPLHNQFTYSAAPDPDVEEITSVFEELSETFEWGRRLSYLDEHNRSAIGDELRSMQKQAESRRVRELEALVPVLRRVTADQELDPAVRNQARTLLEIAQTSR